MTFIWELRVDISNPHHCSEVLQEQKMEPRGLQHHPEVHGGCITAPRAAEETGLEMGLGTKCLHCRSGMPPGGPAGSGAGAEQPGIHPRDRHRGSPQGVGQEGPGGTEDPSEPHSSHESAGRFCSHSSTSGLLLGSPQRPKSPNTARGHSVLPPGQLQAGRQDQTRCGTEDLQSDSLPGTPTVVFLMQKPK